MHTRFVFDPAAGSFLDPADQRYTAVESPLDLLVTAAVAEDVTQWVRPRSTGEPL